MLRGHLALRCCGSMTRTGALAARPGERNLPADATPPPHAPGAAGQSADWLKTQPVEVSGVRSWHATIMTIGPSQGSPDSLRGDQGQRTGLLAAVLVGASRFNLYDGLVQHVLLHLHLHLGQATAVSQVLRTVKGQGRAAAPPAGTSSFRPPPTTTRRVVSRGVGALSPAAPVRLCG